MSTEIATVTQPTMNLGDHMRVAEMLARSSLVPAAYRGKPENVLLASLAGSQFGWDATMAMRSFHIIEGQPSLKPEIQLALVRRAGHSVTGETSPEGARVTGRRKDTGDELTVSFTTEDAKRAGLLGKRGPWQQYPAAMCWARAVSQLCRMLFGDCVLGAGYTPEELGGDDEVYEPPTTDIPAAYAKKRVLEACGGDVDAARAAWGDRGSSSITPEELERLVAETAERAVAEAELVEETTVSPFDDPAWNTTEPAA